MHLKLCGPADHAALVELARRFHAEGGDAFLSFDPQKTAWWLARAIVKKLALAAVTDAGEIAGALALDDDAPRYSSEVALWDIGFYVSPEHRNSRAAVLLRDGAKAIAQDMGLPLFLGVSSGLDLERVDKFFTRAGFQRLGALYAWR